MNKLLNLYGVKIHSERAFLSFLENSRNEVEAFSSSYLERKIGNLVFSLPADGASIGLNHVVPFLQSSESWHGLVSRPATEASQDSLFIRPKIGGNYTRNSLRFLPIQADVAFNTTVGNEVTFKPSGFLLGFGSKLRITGPWLSEETVNGRIQKIQFVPAVRERSFSIESRRELIVETKYGLLTLADLNGISRGLDAGDEVSCQCVLTATFERGDFVGKQNLVAQVYSVIQGALAENKPEKFIRFFLNGCNYRVVEHPVFKGKPEKIFSQLSGDCAYAKIVRRNNKALIRDRLSVLVWKTPIGSFVLAFDLTADGINGVYLDSAENYSLKEEVLFFRWVEQSGRLLPWDKFRRLFRAPAPPARNSDQKIFDVSLILVKHPKVHLKVL